MLPLIVVAAVPAVLLASVEVISATRAQGAAELWTVALESARLARPFALLAGILPIASEFRRGTIVETLLLTPSRRTVVITKMATGAGCAAALSLVVLLAAALSAILVGWRIDSVLALGSGSPLRLLLLHALYGGLGAALVCCVQSGTAAVAGSLVFLLLVEPLLLVLLRSSDWEFVLRFLPAGIDAGVLEDNPAVRLQMESVLPPAVGGLMLLAYACTLAYVAVQRLERNVPAG